MKLAPPLTVSALAMSLCTGPAWAVAYGHHGGLIVHCEPPHFFDESPASEAKASGVKTFNVTASDNTDPATVKAFVNNQPVAVNASQERSGQFRIEGQLPETAKGRVWLKVTADSHDGCDDYKSWFVTIGD